MLKAQGNQYSDEDLKLFMNVSEGIEKQLQTYKKIVLPLEEINDMLEIVPSMLNLQLFNVKYRFREVMDCLKFIGEVTPNDSEKV